MAALLVILTVVLAVAHWLMSPLSAALTPLLELHPLPWLLVLLGAWLLAGRPTHSR